ncbi:bifunctional aminoglycoside phosphotransferase/ATP-binding protein [Bordetella sp. 2513F-2]
MAGHGTDTERAQEEVLDWLCGPHMLGGEPGGVTSRRTHISVIAMAGQRVFKLKRAVRLPYLDFSTPEIRLRVCRRELALNRRTAPAIYRTVHRVTREADGSLALDGKGELVDAVLEMARFDEAGLFENLARQGLLTPALAGDAAVRVARFHAAAPVVRRRDGAASIQHVLEGAVESLVAADALPRAEVAVLVRALRLAFDRHAALLDARAARGEVRRCHGDLHLGNLCLLDGVPTLFDCLEFDEELATTDVLYDLAFLLMDLWQQGLREQANAAFNRYLDEAGQADGLPLLPPFMALRAAIRAHIAGGRASQAQGEETREFAGEAHHLLEAALAMLQPAAPVLVAVGGFSGSGKSTVAAGLAPGLGQVPGARVLSSDRIRKRMHKVDPLERLPESAYRPDMSERVYAAQAREARAALRAGSAVVADAVFDRAQARERIAGAAQAAGVPFQGLWLQADPERLAERVRSRRNDPSDATEAVLRAQLVRAEEAQDDTGWEKVDAGGAIADTLAHARRAIGRP